MTTYCLFVDFLEAIFETSTLRLLKHTVPSQITSRRWQTTTSLANIVLNSNPISLIDDSHSVRSSALCHSVIFDPMANDNRTTISLKLVKVNSIWLMSWLNVQNQLLRKKSGCLGDKKNWIADNETLYVSAK